MKDKDKVLKEMQIQIYTYEQINGGNSNTCSKWKFL